MALPDSINQREYNKFVEDSSGNVAIRITGVTGVGDVDGPSASTAFSVAVFADTTGKLLQSTTSVIVNAGSATGRWIDINSPTTTSGRIINVSTADSLTTGRILNLISNSGDTSTRTLVQVTNDNSAATGATPVSIQQDAAGTAFYVDQNANGISLAIDSDATSQEVIRVSSAAQTTGIIINVPNADSLTTGSIGRFISNSSDTSTRNLIQITNDNTAATGTTLLNLNQDANQHCFTIDHDGTSTNAFRIITALNTTGAIISVPNADSLTTAAIANLVSNSSDTSARNLLFIQNDNTAATGASCIKVIQDANVTAGAINITTSTGAGHSLVIAHSSAGTSGINFTTTSQAGGNIINIPSANSLTTGKIANFVSNSSDTSARQLIQITNDNTAAT